jgi:hypothetical protein
VDNVLAGQGMTSIPLNMKKGFSFQTSGTEYPAMWSHFTEERNPQNMMSLKNRISILQVSEPKM